VVLHGQKLTGLHEIRNGKKTDIKKREIVANSGISLMRSDAINVDLPAHKFLFANSEI
jgi:hypothetical protein